MTIEPSSGVIESYSQIPIKFLCKSRVGDDHKIWTRNYCIANEKEGAPELESVHEYTALFNFDNREEAKVLLMTAKSICPKLKFSCSLLDFGECSVNERKDIKVFAENKHTDKDVELKCPNVSHFYAKPEYLRLKSGEQKEVNVTFRPKNLGKFDLVCDFMLNTYFNIPMRVVGIALAIAPRHKKIRGPAATMEHFREKPEYVPENRTLYQFKKPKTLDKIVFSTTQESLLPDLYAKSNISEKLDAYQIAKCNRKKYNEFLKSSRQDRVNKGNKKLMLTQMKEVEEKIKLYYPLNSQKKDADEDPKADARPIDINYLFNANKDGLDSPRVEVPTKPDTLYVTKPVGNYEPYDVTATGQKFAPDPNVVFKEFPEKPSSHAEVRDCNNELTGEMLQKIQVGPTTIDFGSIFIKSKMHKYFQVKNDLRSSIMVRIQANDDDLKGSYQKPQIIPSGKVAGFKVELCSMLTKNLATTMNYIINDKIPFKFMVKANVIPVNLQLSRTNVKFAFHDENLDMDTTERIKIINEGNARGHYDWVVPEGSSFKVDPPGGHVEPQSFVWATI
jgi:hypothetical protein